MRKANYETAVGKGQTLRQNSIMKSPQVSDVIRTSRNKGGHYAKKEGEVTRIAKGDSSINHDADALGKPVTGMSGRNRRRQEIGLTKANPEGQGRPAGGEGAGGGAKILPKNE